MTTTELIKILKKFELGACGRSRKVSFSVDGAFIPEPDISINSTGTGIAGAEICLLLKTGR